MIQINEYNKIKVLRDDVLIGGTKSVLMPHIVGGADEYVYASPVYGGFQIALSAYCTSIGKQATIFCAKRRETHENTLRCIAHGAKVVEVEHGYLSVVEKRARDYCAASGAQKLEFGAKTKKNKSLIAERMWSITKKLGEEPEEIWCAIGSGMLVEGILEGTQNARVYGVQVGAEYTETHERLTVLKYKKPFGVKSKAIAPFPSTPNYDLKAWELCVEFAERDNYFAIRNGKRVLFWNVL